MIKQYELMVVLSGQSSQDEVKSFVQTIEKLVSNKKGKVDSTELLGKRQLAYEIRKQREGYYVLFRISMEASEASSFEREVRLLEVVLRHLFILFDEKKQAEANKQVSATVEEHTSEE